MKKGNKVFYFDKMGKGIEMTIEKINTNGTVDLILRDGKKTKRLKNVPNKKDVKVQKYKPDSKISWNAKIKCYKLVGK